MIQIDGLRCTWDFKDRLVAVEDDAMRAEYRYDFTDRRIIKRVWSKPFPNAQSSTLNPPSAASTYAESKAASDPNDNLNPQPSSNE